MTSCHSPPVLHGMSLVHLIRCHITVLDLGHIVRDGLSGTKPSELRWERETEQFLGFVLLDSCRTLSSLYSSSQLELVTDIRVPVDIVRLSIGDSTRVSKVCPVLVPFM
jgi:hypothetical protein